MAKLKRKENMEWRRSHNPGVSSARESRKQGENRKLLKFKIKKGKRKPVIISLSFLNLSK